VKKINSPSGIKEEAFKHSPKMKGWKKVLLGMPVLLSTSWMFYIQYNQRAYSGMELLSPANTAPLMIALVLFTIGYVIFMLMMFSENIREFLAKKSKH
jgi:hypothetical protein